MLYHKSNCSVLRNRLFCIIQESVDDMFEDIYDLNPFSIVSLSMPFNVLSPGLEKITICSNKSIKSDFFD